MSHDQSQSLATRPSTSTFNPSPSQRSRSISAGSRTILQSRIVTTVPPWGEQESNMLDDDLPDEDTRPSSPPTSSSLRAAAHFSTLSSDIQSTTKSHYSSTSKPNLNWRSFGERSKRLPSHFKRTLTSKIGEKQGSPNLSKDNLGSHDAMRLELPIPPPPVPFTVAQTQTPGWDVPWTPAGPRFGMTYEGSGNNVTFPPSSLLADVGKEGKSDVGSNQWFSTKRKKALRSFILNNTYVPLLFRVLNLLFTTAAMAIAIRIRRIELDQHLLGIIGSSPILVIIFAPLTMIHVIWAIYLEYFGRPLGLWRTSAKLVHTLSETLFICAWSAALSLCFDNIFTTALQCTPVSSIKWYSQLPPPVNPLTGAVGRTSEGGLTDRICDSQIALIALVAVGLCSYCANLVISLFRIFEKVKVHTHSLQLP